jgi:isoleucyl-tRNA synthetase
VAAIIKDELNVKEVRSGPDFELDTVITRELRLEGLARDAVRAIQDERKRAGLSIEDRIVLHVEALGDWADVLDRFGTYIAAETLAVEVRRDRPEGMPGREVGGELWIGLTRAG